MKRELATMHGSRTRTVERDPIRRFSESMQGVVISLEMRSADELALDAKVNPDAALREHALYQLVDKLGPEALPHIETALFNDPDPQVRREKFTVDPHRLIGERHTRLHHIANRVVRHYAHASREVTDLHPKIG